MSAEDQATADERIPLLLDTPAAVRFCSYEPAIGPVDFTLDDDELGTTYNALSGIFSGNDGEPGNRLDWLIVGSESGPSARQMEIEWARSVVEQCRVASVPCFVKQIATAAGRAAGDHKGGNPEHWPTGEWPREFPKTEVPAK